MSKKDKTISTIFLIRERVRQSVFQPASYVRVHRFSAGTVGKDSVMIYSKCLELYDRYAHIFFNIFKRVTGDQQKAEEQLFELFREIHRQVPQRSIDLGAILDIARKQLGKEGYDISRLSSSEALIHLASTDQKRSD